MHTPRITRRQFLQGVCATATVGAIGPRLIFGTDAHAAANGHDTVVSLFLRGGMDGLNLVLPIAGADRTHYEEARPTLAIPVSGTYGALPLTLAAGTGTGFGLHPSATGLRDLWNAGRMAIVHSAGLLTSVTRSHFDAQLMIDLGTPGQQGGGVGWLARAMNTQPGMVGSEAMPALGISNRQIASLNGTARALAMASPNDFRLNGGPWQWQMAGGGRAITRGVNEVMGALWGGPTGLETDGLRADAALDVVATQTWAAIPATWPNNAFSRQLWTIAQAIRFGFGLRYATLDLGGWDTHDGQGSAGSGYHYYQNKIAELSAALAAFHAELDATGHMSRVTVTVQSEFGRRVRENANRGTDHGYGNPMLVIGGAVNGRRFYGDWRGLHPETLSPYFGDVPVTTDHRRVLSEILIRRMGNANIGAIFPNYAAYSPLGIVQGADIAPVGMAGAVAAVAGPAIGTAPPMVGGQVSAGVSSGPVVAPVQIESMRAETLRRDAERTRESRFAGLGRVLRR